MTSVIGKITHLAMIVRNHRINGHIVVFESDDWGSVRIPSEDALSYLQRRGVEFCMPDSYDKVDSLASDRDLECLHDVLTSVRDAKGNPAKITMNTCVANPDFTRIRESGFTKYSYEPFTDTLKRYPGHERAFSLWKEGIRENVFKPQFHGREHLEAYNIISKDEKDGVAVSIEEGLVLFEKIFGFKSRSMIAPCYVWDDYIEDIAYKNGVKYLQGGYIQRHSEYHSDFGKRFSGHYFGETNKNGQKYLIRNCTFEPSQNPKYNADFCLRQIDNAFRMKLPAIVSCHRLNFIGSLVPNNRDSNLKDFSCLLKTLVKKYPDIEFRSSDEVFA